MKVLMDQLKAINHTLSSHGKMMHEINRTKSNWSATITIDGPSGAKNRMKARPPKRTMIPRLKVDRQVAELAVPLLARQVHPALALLNLAHPAHPALALLNLAHPAHPALALLNPAHPCLAHPAHPALALLNLAHPALEHPAHPALALLNLEHPHPALALLNLEHPAHPALGIRRIQLWSIRRIWLWPC